MLTTRCDIITKLLDSKTTFNSLISTQSAGERGYIFESVFVILAISKCLPVDYTSIHRGALHKLIKCQSCTEILNITIRNQSDGVSDLTLKLNDVYIVFSSKHNMKKISPDCSDVINIRDSLTHANLHGKIGLVVRNADDIRNHQYKSKSDILKSAHEQIIADKLLFGECDVIQAIDVFKNRFKFTTSEQFTTWIDENYLAHHKKPLRLMVHQQLALTKFTQTSQFPTFMLATRTRGGKMLTLLMMAKSVLQKSNTRVLILTSVPATIQAFIKELATYIDFNNINVAQPKDFMKLKQDWSGIAFCSMQYLKTRKSELKLKQLRDMKFSSIIVDESHIGCSNDNTKSNVLNFYLKSLNPSCVRVVFATATSVRTQSCYQIPESCTSTWTSFDDQCMKNINPDTIKIMTQRHGSTFESELNNVNLNSDYRNVPIQVLIQPKIENTELISEWNHMYPDDQQGFNIENMLELQQRAGKSIPKFKLASSSGGRELLIKFFTLIINNNVRKPSILKTIESTQAAYSSAQNTIQDPHLTLIYLPIGNLEMLQQTMVEFIQSSKLWLNYQVEYTNCKSNSQNIASYPDFVKYITSIQNKKCGRILLLGRQGSVGITYPKCFSTISLDNGHDIDDQFQRVSRSSTPESGKRISINVDLNIQRCYNTVMHKIATYRQATKSQLSNSEILKYFYTTNMFIFNAHEFEFANSNINQITSYYDNYADEMSNLINDQYLLDNIECQDQLVDNLIESYAMKINSRVQGVQSDVETCTTSKKCISDVSDVSDDEENKENKENKENDENQTPADIVILINRTREMCKSFLFPLLVIISIRYKIDFVVLFETKTTSELICSLIKEKLINFKAEIVIPILMSIVKSNLDILVQIREIYAQATPDKLRTLIARHFIPTQAERKQHAEIPTPVELVDQMLDKIPPEFWNEPHRVFEPCCGKGNFVVAIFDKFYQGLSTAIPDAELRCRTIITECLYYADISALNVWITTQILQCHTTSKCGRNVKLQYNSHVGDTLELNVGTKWGSVVNVQDDVVCQHIVRKKICGRTNCAIKTHIANKPTNVTLPFFDAVIGNPPYQAVSCETHKRGARNSLWNLFVEWSIIRVKLNGYIVLVHPGGWRNVDGRYKSVQRKLRQLQMIYLEIHNERDGLQLFGCETRYDWYVVKNYPCYTTTKIRFEDGELHDVDISKFEFIPNRQFKLIESMLAGINDKCVDVIYSSCLYEMRTSHMSAVLTEKYKHPCVYTVNFESKLRLAYSSIKHGHFGIPKFIWSNGRITSIGSYIDTTGEYGLTNWSYAIVDEVKNLQKIKTVFDSKKFRELMVSCAVGQNNVNYKAIRLFKSDFYKLF